MKLHHERRQMGSNEGEETLPADGFLAMVLLDSQPMIALKF